MAVQAVAVFSSRSVHGDVTFEKIGNGVKVIADFTRLPPGEHGFHIHRAGDMRGSGCKNACEHYHIGKPQSHGGPPFSKGERHTGDLGNISLPQSKDPTIRRFLWLLKGVDVEDLWGRSVIVHADPDDLGLGDKEDSNTTGHSGARIACAVIGRTQECTK
jgi:Cu-Zn family superoxide dismutase